MKVTEIISEASGKAGLASTAWHAMGKLIGTSKSSTVEKAAQDLGQMGRKVLPSDVQRYLKSLKSAEVKTMVKSDPSIIDLIAKKANGIRKPGMMGWAASKASFGGVIGFFTNLGFAASAGTALWNYHSRMSDAEQNLSSGAWTEDEYATVRQHEMSVLITALVASLPRTAAGLVGILGKIPLVGGLFRIPAVQAAGVSAYAAWINTDQAREYIAALAVLSTKDVPIIGPILSSLGIEADVSQVVGATGTGILDWFKQKLPGSSASPTSVTVTPNSTGTVATTAPQGQVTPEPYVPTATRATDVAGWR